MSTQQLMAPRLFDLQPKGSDIPIRACQWAVAHAEGVLGRTLHLADLDVLGSRLSVPLLLLASTRTTKVFKWSIAHRRFVGSHLLERLREEGWPVAHEERLVSVGASSERFLVCGGGSVSRQMLRMCAHARVAGGIT